MGRALFEGTKCWPHGKLSYWPQIGRVTVKGAATDDVGWSS